MNFTRYPFYVFSFFLLFLVSCISSKRHAPNWVNNVPSDSTSYLGIGMALKAGNSDYISKSKEIALAELTNSIQVNVSTESVLNQAETNKAFNESFSSTTKLNSNNFLYEIEKFDAWENKKEYWVFYKINKTEYEKIRKAKITEALNQSYLLYKEGLKFEADKDHINSLMKFLQSFEIISPFLNESLTVSGSNEKPLFLGKEVYAKIFSFYKEYEIQYLLPKTNSTNEPFGDYLKLKFSFKKYPLSNFPVIVTTNNKSTIAGQYNTDKNGELKILVPFKDRSAGNSTNITISADMAKLINEVIRDGTGKNLLSTLSANQESFPLNFSQCSNMGNESQQKDSWNFDNETQKNEISNFDNKAQKNNMLNGNSETQMKDVWDLKREANKLNESSNKSESDNLSYDSHEKLMKYLKKNAAMENKLAEALTGCKINYQLSVPQVVEIVKLFKFDNYKWQAVEFLLAGIGSKKAYKEALKSEFFFDDYKEKLEKL